MNYVRDAQKAKGALAKDDQGRRIAKAPLYIHTPVRFVEKGLSVLGVRTYVYGAMPIIMADGTYMVSNICARVEITPDQTKIITIDDVDYYEFFFEKDSVVFPSAKAIQDDKIIYFVLDELIFKAKVPWYMAYDDLCNILATAKEFANFGGATIQETLEMFAAIVCRTKQDENTFVRMAAKFYADVQSNKVQYVPMESVYLSVPGTINRISGAYFEPAVEGALVHPSKSVDNMQRILRA